MSIRSIAYDFGIFVIFSMFVSVILFFPKHSNSRVFLTWFTKKSCKSAKQDIWRLVKTLGRSRMKNHEASEDVTEGGILFPGSKTSVMEANTQTDGKTEIYAFEHTRRRPEHVPCAPSIPQVPRACILCTLRRSNHSLCAPSIAECWPKLFFTTF